MYAAVFVSLKKIPLHDFCDVFANANANYMFFNMWYAMVFSIEDL